MGEPRFVFKSCCFGISLRTAAYIIAGVSLFLELVGAIGGIYMGVAQGREEGWINLVIEIINAGLAAMLIYGIKVTRQDLVFLWVWGSVMMVILSFAVGILMIVYAKTVLGAVIMLSILGLQIYFIFVVRSYAHSIGEPSILPANSA